MMLRTFAQGIGSIGMAMLLEAGCAPHMAAAGDSAVTRIQMSLRQPEVAKVGKNRFRVVVEDAAGQPLENAEVSLTLYRRGVPGSKGYIEHPIRTKVDLAPGEKAGTYEAFGPILASGMWDVNMQVKPRGAGGRKISATTKIWADD